MNTKRETLVTEANFLIKAQKSFKSRNDKIMASRKSKELILALNEIYKVTREKDLMDIMKDLTAIKRKVETRLYGNIVI